MRILFFLLAFNCYGQLLTEEDKQQHFIGGAVFSSPTFSEVYLNTKDIGKAFTSGLLVSTLVGTGKELMDDKFDKRDLLATMLGSITVNTLLTTILIINDKGIKIFGKQIRAI